MSTVSEMKLEHLKILNKKIPMDISKLIISFTHIIAYDECQYCCDSACEKGMLYNYYWRPFKVYCDNHYNHRFIEDMDVFTNIYEGEWNDTILFAKEICKNDVWALPDYIKKYIDWKKLWDNVLSLDYYVYDNHMFKIL
jgi:hypothetical protein